MLESGLCNTKSASCAQLDAPPPDSCAGHAICFALHRPLVPGVQCKCPVRLMTGDAVVGAPTLTLVAHYYYSMHDWFSFTPPAACCMTIESKVCGPSTAYAFRDLMNVHA